VAAAYLSPSVVNRPNLTIAIQVTAEKILFDEHSSEPRAIGVQVSNSPAGPKFRVKATKEVIISAGAISTPQLLLLSGLGPKDELGKVGVKVVKELSQVGKNYYDVSNFDNTDET